MGRLCTSLAAMALALSSAGSSADEARPQWRFHLPGDTVAFRGVSTFDSAGLADPPMIYAGGAAGLVVGVIAHALISQTRRDRQKNAIRAQADEVLLPYADAIAHFEQRDLLERSFVGMTEIGDKLIDDHATGTSDAWLIDYAPVFSMSQDQRAIVLDNFISITRSGRPEQPIYRNTVRVVSVPRTEEEPQAWWATDDANPLKAESARLLALSFDIVFTELRRGEAELGPALPMIQRTWRYQFGTVERMERGELVRQDCDRLVMRTLRGWVLSAPNSRTPERDADGHPCVARMVAGGS